MPRLLRSLCLLALLVTLLGCARTRPEAPAAPPVSPPAPVATATPQEGPTVNWEITSSAFANGERIPVKYTGDGANASPPLAWTRPPEGTQELVLICNDPDAPSGSFTHWVLYGLSPEVTALPESLPREASLTSPACRQGTNSAGRIGYFGPAPPPGRPHRYQFTLYAVSAPTGLPAGADKARVLRAMEGKVVGTATLEGLYGR